MEPIKFEFFFINLIINLNQTNNMKKFLLSLIVMVLSVLSAHADWEKTTSIAVGDVVVLAYDDENVSKELSEVTSSGTTIGVVADYETSPAGTYPLTVVAGSTEGSFAFKTSEDTYLAWSSGNSLKTIDEVTDASSWTVSFTAAGAADIYNVGIPVRKLQYNAGSPRFACYGNAGQKAPYLWKQVAEGSLPAPSITPSSGTFFETQTVTISAEDGATIYYTLDGTDPTTESTEYSEALSISETTTVKAIAEKDSKTSSVATVTITFGPVYDNFAAANTAATADRVVSRLTFTEALVLYVNGQNAYIQDATGAMMLYGTSTLKAGDKISGYVEGELYLYNGLPEVANITLNAETVSSDNEVVPTVVDAAALAENPLAFVSQYVQVSPAKFAEDKEVSTVTNVNFTVGETALILRNNFSVEFSVEAAKQYTVAGIVTIYKGNLQLYPLAASDIAEIVPPEPVVTAVVNGDFSEGAVADNHICTYAKDMETNATTYSNMLEVEGWTAVNNGDGRAAGIMAYGSGKWIGGTGFNVPEFNPAGLNRGAALGVVAVWSADAQYTQATTFAPGYYVLTARINNVGGETATASNFFGVHVGETSYFAENKTYPVNQWTRENVLFQVEEEAEGYFSLGYKATNAGNAAQQHLFYDEVVVKAFESEEARTAYLTDLTTADEADAAVYAFVEARFAKTAAIDALAPVGDGLFEYSQTAIDDAKAAVATAENIEAVEAVAMPVATAPDAEKQYTLKLKDGGMYMSINEGIKLAEEEYPFQLEAVEGGYAIKNGESYVAFTGTGNNTWTMNATAEPYAWTINSLGDGYYTIAKATKNTEYIGVDNTTAGSSCYANKSVGDKSLWALAEAMVYGVKVAEAENGSVEANPTEGYVGTKITLTVNPDEGYQLDELTVTYGDGQVVEVSEENTFVMPADNVTIIPSFKQIPEIVAAYGEIPTEETTFGADDDKSIDIATDYFTIAQAQDTIKVTVAGVGEEAQIAIYNKNDVAIDGLTQNVAAEQTEVDFILTEEQIAAILGTGEEPTARAAFKVAALREYIHVKGKNLTVNKVELVEYQEPKSEAEIAYEAALAVLEDGMTYRISASVKGDTYYLKSNGYLTDNVNEATTFTFNAVNADGTLYATGWNLNCKFTNPTLTNGSTGDVENDGHIHTQTNQNRNDWERQVFFLKNGKFAVRSTNANSENWGANTYWAVIIGEEMPEAGYSFEAAYNWDVTPYVDLTEFNNIVAELEAAIAASENYTDESGTAANTATEALAAVKEGSYTSVAQVKAAIGQVIAIGRTFFGAIQVINPIDVTKFYITNPTPVAHNSMAPGWEGDNFGESSNGVSEYWNKSAVGFHQTISLPAGDYKLSVVALQRTNMQGYVYAGETQTVITGVPNSTANSREQAATWFDQGNGVNNVVFTMAQAGDVVIGLTTDNTTGDHWTVWREFNLAKIDALAEVRALYNEAIAAVYEAITDETYQNILGSGVETNNLRNALPQEEPTTREGYEAAIEAINTAFAAWKASAPSYDQLMNALNVAQLFGVDVDAELETIGEDESYSAAKAIEDAVKYKMQVADIVTENYTANVSAKLGEWTDNNIGENHGQHYDGTSESTYMEQKDGWGGSSWDASRTQTVTLPKGAYVLKVAARSSSAANAYVSITVGATETQMPFPNKNDAGFGIDTEGNLTFAADANYANNGNGRGWEWIFVPFTLAEDGDATITFAGSATSTHQWMSFTAWDLLQNPTTTGINGIRNNSELFKNADVYDLSGRKVQNPTRGLYIVNGRKVVIK